jgi:hypothetical protein
VILWALLLTNTILYSQESIFGLHAVLGLNASQISGDELAGFDKVGLQAGLRGTAELNDKAGLSVELLYSRRGSRPDIFDEYADPDINITLQYLDLPVYVTYADWYDETLGYHKAYAAAGFSYGRLIEASTFDHYNTGDADLDLLVDEFNQNDVSWLLGFGFRLSKRFMITARYTRSITLLLNARKKNLNRHSLLPYFLTFRGEYIF